MTIYYSNRLLAYCIHVAIPETQTSYDLEHTGLKKGKIKLEQISLHFFPIKRLFSLDIQQFIR